MTTKSSIHSSRPVLWLIAIMMAAFTGCGDAERDDPSKPLPPIIISETPKDLRLFISDQIAASSKRIVIPPGRYHLQAERGSHLTLSNLSDVEIIAENVELVCTSTIRAVHFDNCTNVTLRGLTIDYDPLPFTQGEIIAMAHDKSWIDFQIIDGYPQTNLGGSIQIYNPHTATLRRGDGRWDNEIKPLGNGRFRVSKADRYKFNPAEDTEEIGDILIAKSSTGQSGSPHAIELRNSKGVRLEDITVFASPSFGFLERGCHANTYLRCVVARRPPENDPVPRSIPRMRSLNADAFHSKDASQGPAILSCTAHFMGDDAVNINGRYHFVRGGSGREVRVAVIDNHAAIQAGDPVEFLPFAGPRPPDATVVSRRNDPEPLTEEEKSFIRTLGFDARMRTSLLENKARLHILTLDRAVSLQRGSAIACSKRLGHGFSVKDCDFGNNRSRGILIKASNGEISGNRITNTRMNAILVSPEFWWMEAGLSSGIVIKDNHISGSLRTPIEIHARGGSRRVLPAGAFRDISILNNRFEDSAWPLIHVTSTTGLTIQGNSMPNAPSPSAQPIILEECETR